MDRCGLVSVSFRSSSPEDVIRAAAEAGLSCIEWGSDVHAPCNDGARLAAIAALQERYGIRCCSYGTYFRLGVTPIEELPGYIAAAKQLGCRILRLWCSDKAPGEHTPEQKQHLFTQCREAARMAEEADVVLCMECHIRSFTETKEGTLELLAQVDSPAFRMYWQPNQFRSEEENLEYAKAIRDEVEHVHVFLWKGKERFPLEEGVDQWRRYLAQLPPECPLLLEFMPDDRIESLGRETAALRKILGGTT